MTSSAAYRAIFISSMKAFLPKYKFQGVDLLWAWSSADDTANYVALVKEMRAAFASELGISVALPPRADFLSVIDVNTMDPYVDFFNIMSYGM